jgi:hypothetical protein
VAIVAVCILPAANVGSAITGTFGNPLPSSDQSVLAQNAYNAEFPNATSAPSSAIVLLESSNMVGPVGKNATIAITQSLAQDRNLKEVSSVASLYTAYSDYLAGEVELGWSFLGPALNGTSSLPAAVNQTAFLLWAPTAAYMENWERDVVNLSSTAPTWQADAPAYAQTLTMYPAGSLQVQVLAAFYNGSGSSGVGFNQSISEGCLTKRMPRRAPTPPCKVTSRPSSPRCSPLPRTALLPRRYYRAWLWTTGRSSPRSMLS